jgi:hypothetical protein
MLLLDKLPYLLGDWQRENQFIEAPSWRRLKDCLFARLIIRLCGRRGSYCNGTQRPLEAICQDVMILTTLFCDNGLDRRAQSCAIASCTGADNRKKEIASCHRASPRKRSSMQ